MDAAVIVIERTYDTPVDTVWKALTDISKIAQWIFKLESFKAELGSAINFSGNNTAKIVYECVVTELIPAKKLSYSFTYKGHPQQSMVTFALFPEGEKTRLILTHSDLNNKNINIKYKNYERSNTTNCN